MAESTLFAQERKVKIVEYVELHRKATVAELCDTFSVSSATIRNDLRELEHSNLIIRTHGGAMLKTKTGLELDSRQKEDQRLEAKRQIARSAIELVEDGDTIILDTGTTTLEFARELRSRRRITIVTNDLPIALELEQHPEATVILMGGILRRGFHCAVPFGEARAQIMSGLVVDKAFMGTNGFTFARGATTPDINTADTKKLMVSMAASVILLCDSSKFGRDSFAQFAPPEVIDKIITEACPEFERKQIEELGIDLICG